MSAKLSDFHANLDAFTQVRQLTWSQGKEEHMACLDIEGFPINLLYMHDRGLLFIQSGVGIPPQEPAQQSALWKRLLKANNGFAETGGATLGYDEDADMITLQVSWPLDGLDRQSFDNLLENVITLLAQWLLKLSQNEEHGNSAGHGNDDASHTHSAPDAIDHHNMLRI